MATASQLSMIDQIGAAAGMIWSLLNEQGSMGLSKLVKEVNAPRDVVMQAVGWLAREEKLHIDDSRSKVVSLRE